MMKFFALFVFLPVACLLFCGCDSAGGMKAEELSEKMKSAYSSMGAFREVSSCSTTDAVKNASSEVVTEVMYKRPNLLRIETKGKKNKALIVSDGSDLYVNFNDSKDVNSRPAPDSSSALYSRLSASSSYPADSVVNEFFLLDGRFPSDYVESSSVAPRMEVRNGVKCYVLSLSYNTGITQTLLVDSKRWLILENRISLKSDKGAKIMESVEVMTSVEPDFEAKDSMFSFDLKGRNVLRPADLEKKVLAFYSMKGKRIPEFTAEGADGAKFSSKSLKGMRSVILFWDPLYKPSFDAVKAIGKVSRTDGVGSRFKFIAFADESSADERKAVFSSCGAGFANLYDKGGKISDSFGVKVLPHVLIVSEDGVVLDEIAGLKSEDEYLKDVKAQLK